MGFEICDESDLKKVHIFRLEDAVEVTLHLNLNGMKKE